MFNFHTGVFIKGFFLVFSVVSIERIALIFYGSLKLFFLGTQKEKDNHNR